jgi:DNA polymerase-1
MISDSRQKVNGERDVFPSNARDAAGFYLDRGLAILPIPPRTKEAIVLKWSSLRITSNQIDTYFPHNVDKNIGVLNGEPSNNLADVDLDTPEARSAASLFLPPTGWIFGRASSRRSHWIFRSDEPVPKAQEVFKDVDGTMLVELRGTGGQTVFPPSVHPSGESIVWERFDDEPRQVPLDELRQAVSRVAAVAILAKHWPSKGSRHEAFLAFAGGLHAARVDEDQALALVDALCKATGDEEKRIADVRSTYSTNATKTTGWTRLASLLTGDGKAVVKLVKTWLGVDERSPAAKKAPRRVRIPEPFKPFPSDFLAEPLRGFVQQCAKSRNLDDSFFAMPALAVLASAVGNVRSVRIDEEWYEPMILWTAVIGDSGTGKTTGWKAAMKPVFDKQSDFKREHDAEMREFKPDPKNGLKPPRMRFAFADDVTFEFVATLLQEEPRGILASCDELSTFIDALTRYKDGAGNDRARWIKCYGSQPLPVGRKTGETPRIFIPHAAASITGGIQPEIWRTAMRSPGFMASGFGPRFLVAHPPRRLMTRNRSRPSTEVVVNRYAELYRGLRGLEFATNKNGNSVPFAVPLSTEADSIFTDYHDESAKERFYGDSETSSILAKLVGVAARLALLDHLIRCVSEERDDRFPIDASSMKAGVELARWFAYEARRNKHLADSTSEDLETQRLIESIKANGGTITARDLRHRRGGAFPTSDEAEAALQALADQGYGTVERVRKGRKGKLSFCFTLATSTTSTTSTNDDDDPDDDDPDDDPTPTRYVNLKSDRSGDRAKPLENKGIEDAADLVDVVDVDVADFFGNRESSEPTSTDEASRFLVDVAPRNGTPLDTPPSTPSTGFSLIDSTDRLETVAIAIDDSSSVGIDLETTGLNWRTDRVRLMTLSCDSIGDDRQIFIVDCFKVDPSPLFEYLESKPLIGHNLAFDLAFLARMGFTPRGELRDTMLMSRVATAGTGDKNTLAACCDRVLGVTIDKAEQAGDWSRPTLRPEQLRYAAADVRTLDKLERRLFSELVNARLAEVAEIESRCLPAMNWMSTAGVPFDLDAWRELASTAAADVKRLEAELDAIAPAVPGEARLLAAAWKWTSHAQVKQALELAGLALESTDDEALAAIDHPLAELLREHRGAVKRSTTYGTDWLKHVDPDGRVYPSWNQIGADSGRMSCSNPNMQQLPRGDYRRCVAAPAGRVLIKADYSQIELRIAAKMSGDAAMLAAYRGGEDLHAKTAQAVVGKQEITKADRQLAKALNFGLLYGMGAKGFACYAKTMYRIELSETMAKRYRDAFFRTYRGLAAWHTRVRSQAVAETRTLSGRRRLLKPDTPDTQRLNTPVQGTGADGLKIALALLWERREQAVDSFPILAVHDEIVVEAPEDRADQAAAWLKAAMLDAMTPLIDPVPVEVEISISNTWGKS